MIIRRQWLAALLAVVLAPVCGSVFADDARGWETIAGGPGTGCATDATAYEFYVKQGDPQRIAIYFEGGGGCWNARNCGLEGQRTFENSVDDADRPWVKFNTGIFETANPRNPLRDFTIVMAPYCTADVHLGVRTSRFETPDGKRLDVHHRGLTNAQSALDWILERHAAPKVVFVSGGSAGALASPVFAAHLAREYPRARVVQLGDAAGAYRTARLRPLFEAWGTVPALKNDPLFRSLEPASVNFEDFYVRAARVRNLQLAQINSIEDQVQKFFLGQVGHEVRALAPLLSGNIADLRKVDRKLRTYTMPGAVHEILRRPQFYEAAVGEIALVDWVDDLIHGRRVPNVGDELLTAPVERLN